MFSEWHELRRGLCNINRSGCRPPVSAGPRRPESMQSRTSVSTTSHPSRAKHPFPPPAPPMPGPPCSTKVAERDSGSQIEVVLEVKPDDSPLMRLGNQIVDGIQVGSFARVGDMTIGTVNFGSPPDPSVLSTCQFLPWADTDWSAAAVRMPLPTSPLRTLVEAGLDPVTDKLTANNNRLIARLHCDDDWSGPLLQAREIYPELQLVEKRLSRPATE